MAGTLGLIDRLRGKLSASGNSLIRLARGTLPLRQQPLFAKMGDIQKVSSEMVGRAHAVGDPVVQEVMRETLDLLAYWLGNIIDLLEPDIIVIGGGFLLSSHPFSMKFVSAGEAHASIPVRWTSPWCLLIMAKTPGLPGPLRYVIKKKCRLQWHRWGGYSTGAVATPTVLSAPP